MGQMTASDGALTEVIEAWLRFEIPGDNDVVNQMTQMAMSYRTNGATVDETCAWVQVLVRSWHRHPSAVPFRAHLRLVTPSGTN